MTFMATLTAVTIAAAAPTSAANAPSSAIKIDLDTSALGEFGEVIQVRLDYEVGEEMRRRNLVADETSPHRVRIVVKSSNADRTGYSYSLESTNGSAQKKVDEKCEPCTEDMAIDAIVSLLPARIDAALRAPTDPQQVEPGTREAAIVPRPVADESAAGNDAPRRNRQEIAGFALIGTGAAITVGGVVLAALPRSFEPDPDGPTRSRARELRTPGFVVLGAGVAVLATGIALAVVGAKKRKRDVAAAPSIGREHVGFGIAGRF